MTKQEFDKHVLDELRLMVSDLENDCELSNVCLYENVREELWKRLPVDQKPE